MMKNKILLCGVILVIMAIIIVFGYTNARYHSTISMTGDLDYIKTIGKISIYHPDWVAGYEKDGPDNGSGNFEVDSIPKNYANIHYQVTNKVNEEINEEEVDYYIRIVAEDGSNNIPIEWDVHEFNNPANILPLETGTGYGPFTLGTTSEVTQEYSIKANWISGDIKYLTETQHLKVQMVKKRTDGTLKVIDDAPLNIKYTGFGTQITLAYYLYGTTVPVGATKTFGIEDNITIDFKNNDRLAELGITLPEGYTFHDIRGNLVGWQDTTTTIVIPEGFHLSGYYFEVYLISPIEVGVELAYYDYSKYTTVSGGNKVYSEIDKDKTRQAIKVNRGTKIDFTNEVQREELKINLPTGYNLNGLGGDLITNKYYATSVTIPSSTTDIKYFIEVYMIPAGKSIVNISYYDEFVSANKLIDKRIIEDVSVGTKINFKDPGSLSDLGVKLPDNYEFSTAYCTEINSNGEGHDNFTIPYDGAGKTYNINVVLSKVVTVITVPAKFYKNGVGEVIKETTVNMKSDGTYDFTTSICRELCPNLDTMTSFTIYITNPWGSDLEIGNTSESPTVNIDYNKSYTNSELYGDYEFKLTNAGTYITIKAWW